MFLFLNDNDDDDDDDGVDKFENYLNIFLVF